MTKNFTIERRFHVRRGRHNRKDEISDAADSRIPRASRLLALAIRFDQLIRDGVVTDQAELARLGQVSRARLTQIMSLLNLAPDIQDDVLYLASAERGREVTSERHLRPIAAVAHWQRQRRMWSGQSSRTNSARITNGPDKCQEQS
jgi:hypothetical protein